MPPNEECPACQQIVSDWHIEWQTQISAPRTTDRDMSILTAKEKSFLDVFLHEATTAPFTGPATEALHRLGVEYGDISCLAWAYEQDVPRSTFGWGHPAKVAPPVPWATRESAMRRNAEIQQICDRQREPAATRRSAP